MLKFRCLRLLAALGMIAGCGASASHPSVDASPADRRLDAEPGGSGGTGGTGGDIGGAGGDTGGAGGGMSTNNCPCFGGEDMDYCAGPSMNYASTNGCDIVVANATTSSLIHCVGSEWSYVSECGAMGCHAAPTGVPDYCNSCTPKTCTSSQCDNDVSDSCGGTIDCGGCPSGQTCNYSTNNCGTTCTPDTCTGHCGDMPDGCGGTLHCGTCTMTGYNCTNNVCTSGTCVPQTCAQKGYNCGTWVNNCGNTLNCGTCQSGFHCSSNKCVADTCMGEGNNSATCSSDSQCCTTFFCDPGGSQPGSAQHCCHRAGNHCVGNDDCCGALLCGSGSTCVCQDAGDPCYDGLDCCGPMQCSSSSGGGSCIARAEGQSCTASGTQCTSPDTCDKFRDTGGTACCRPYGTACSDSSQCCGKTGCSNAGPINGHCDNRRKAGETCDGVPHECAGDLACSGGHCSCTSQGGSCTTDNQCCGDSGSAGSGSFCRVIGTSGGTKCCRGSGFSCTVSSDCCGTTQCLGPTGAKFCN